jgi:hypothetical protein
MKYNWQNVSFVLMNESVLYFTLFVFQYKASFHQHKEELLFFTHCEWSIVTSETEEIMSWMRQKQVTSFVLCEFPLPLFESLFLKDEQETFNWVKILRRNWKRGLCWKRWILLGFWRSDPEQETRLWWVSRNRLK